MKKLNQFYINDYQFKIVRLEVFSGNKNQNEITNHFYYYLLVDENNFIHDYKIEFISLSIKTKTTLSHKESKKNDLALKRRILMIEYLGLENIFGSGKKTETKINNENIKKLNSWALDKSWRQITFKNVEYIISGSNASGEGKGSNSFYTLFRNERYPFGFILQSLNIQKIITNLYIDVDDKYATIWKNINLENYKNFEDWINQNDDLESYFYKFKNDSHDLKWKEHKKEFENKIGIKKMKFKNLEKNISQRRYKFSKSIDNSISNKELVSSANFFYKQYFDIEPNNANTKFEKAHIKPVWLIKQEYKEKNDEKILDQIEDIDNFLPLAGNVHSLYDQKFFYWNEFGELNILKNDINKNEIKNFMKINISKLDIKVKSYLIQYKKFLKEQELI